MLVFFKSKVLGSGTYLANGSEHAIITQQAATHGLRRSPKREIGGHKTIFNHRRAESVNDLKSECWSTVKRKDINSTARQNTYRSVQPSKRFQGSHSCYDLKERDTSIVCKRKCR